MTRQTQPGVGHGYQLYSNSAGPRLPLRRRRLVQSSGSKTRESISTPTTGFESVDIWPFPIPDAQIIPSRTVETGLYQVGLL